MSSCKRCGKPIVWPQPYVKGQPPLEPDGKTNHDCPAWNRDNNNNTSQPPQQQQQQQATVQVGYADISDLRAGMTSQKFKTDLLLEELRKMDAKIDRLVATYEHSNKQPTNQDQKKKEDQKQTEAEAQMDKDKEDGVQGDFS